MNRVAILALFLCALAPVALAKPAAAGKCSTRDDGLPLTEPVGLRPAIIVLPDVKPPKTGPENAFVADLLFDVRIDGTVARARAVCTNVVDARYTKALLGKTGDWRFGAQKPNARYAYRVVISKRGDTITPVPLPAARP
jgi:hypothetical protein